MMLALLGCLLDAAPPPPSVPASPPPAVVPKAEPAVVETEPASPLVTAARAYLGRPYAFGARGTSLDCMGLVFLAYADATGKSWRKISVNPTRIVAKRQLGAPVPGLMGVASASVDYALLRPGDVVFFLGLAENTAEPALAEVDGVPHWVWHMGLYSGGPDRRFVVGDHYAGGVVEPSLPAYLADHADVYDAIFAVRPVLD